VGQSEQSVTIGDQSVPMFHDDVTHRIHLAIGSIKGHPCSTIQGSTWYLSVMTVQALRQVSVFDQAVLLLPCWTNNRYPRPGLNVVIKPSKLALLPIAAIDKAFLIIGMQFSVDKNDKKRQNSTALYPIDRTGYHFRNRWA